MTIVDALTEAARSEINKEIALVEDEIMRLVKVAKAQSDWAKHPIHPYHDAIVAYYAPLIAAALKDSIDRAKVKQWITAAQKKYNATKKASADDTTNLTPAQQAVQSALPKGPIASSADMGKLMQAMATDSYVAGVKTAGDMIGANAAFPSTIDTDVDWDSFWSDWKPGSDAAADVIRSGGLQAVFDRMGVMLDGITDTNVTRIGNAIADGLQSGDSVDTISNAISDAVGELNDTRSLMIANTQTADAMSVASQQSYDANGITQYNWIAEDDACPICEDNADNGPYDVGDDPDPSVPAHPNCRCAYIPVVLTPPSGDDTSDMSADDDGE